MEVEDKMIDIASVKKSPLYSITTERMTFEVQGPEHIEMIANVLGSSHGQFLYGYGENWRASEIVSAGLEHWLKYGFGPMIMREKETSTCLGVVTLWKEYGLEEIEMGGFLIEDKQGNGYALESRLAIRKVAKDHYGIPTLISRVDGKNRRAIELIRRLGAVYECDRVYPYFGQMQVWRHYNVQ